MVHFPCPYGFQPRPGELLGAPAAAAVPPAALAPLHCEDTQRSAGGRKDGQQGGAGRVEEWRLDKTWRKMLYMYNNRYVNIIYIYIYLCVYR